MFKITDPATGDSRYVTTLDGLPDGWSYEQLAEYPTLDMLKAEKRAAIDMRLGEAFLGGFTPRTGPLAGHTLQTRNNTDRTNWLTSQAEYKSEIDAGNGATLGADFRDASNATLTVSYADGHAALLDMGTWGKALMRNSWSLKDQVAAAADAASLDAIDITQGWPT